MWDLAKTPLLGMMVPAIALSLQGVSVADQSLRCEAIATRSESDGVKIAKDRWER